MVVVSVLAALIVLTAFAALHWYLWRRLVRDTTRPGSPWRRVGGVVLGVGAGFGAGAFAALFTQPDWDTVRWLTWPGLIWAVLFLYLLLGVLAGEIIRPLLLRGLVTRDAGTATPAPESLAPESLAPETGTTRGDPDGPQPEPASAAGGAAAEPAGGALIPAATSTGPVESAARVAPERTAAPVDSAAPVTGGRAVESARVSAADTESAGAQGTAGSAIRGADADSGSGSPPGGGDVAGAGGHAPVRASLSRRMLVSRLAAGATVLAAAGLTGTGTYDVLDGPMVRRLTVPLAKLPATTTGFRITLVSDLHLGPALGRGFCERIVRTINATDPDLIAVVGDLADGSAANLRDETAPLAELKARLGTYYVLGNHEYYSDAREWADRVAELGMTVLRNSRVALPEFDIAGVDDPAGENDGGGPDVAAALAGRDSSRACVLLAHQPIVVHDAVKHGVDLQLSGHTHGGQVWPGNLLARLANPTVAGLELYGATALYVTRGAGAWGPPVRVAAPSDITVLDLTARPRV